MYEGEKVGRDVAKTPGGTNQFVLRDAEERWRGININASGINYYGAGCMDGESAAAQRTEYLGSVKSLHLALK